MNTIEYQKMIHQHVFSCFYYFLPKMAWMMDAKDWTYGSWNMDS